MTPYRLTGLLAASLLGSWPVSSSTGAAASRVLMFEERVRAEEAIERVRYAHQIGATQPFEVAVPRGALEARVRRDLADAEALERATGGAPTADDLEVEVHRMERDTRMPERLQEMLAALGHDPLLIREALARPALTARLLSARTSVTEDRSPPWPPGDPLACTSDESWRSLPADPAYQDMESTAVWTGSQMLVWGMWSWTSYSPVRAGGRYDPATDSWSPMSTVNAPINRVYHAMLWTGKEMIVWGGSDGGSLNSGGRYDPIADAWTPTTTTGAPSPRTGMGVVWTGREMVVWGGQEQNPALGIAGDGARYDPLTDTWSPISALGAPTARVDSTAVWTGTRMILWGGQAPDAGNVWSGLVSGALYDPSADTWSPVSTAGAPEGRIFNQVVWTGSRMIIYGGFGNRSNSDLLNNGGVYDPATDSWSPTSMIDAAEPRSMPTTVWTGTKMLLWGGCNAAGCPAEGRLYDPAADTWSLLSAAGAPQGRSFHAAVWTGREMLVWGGITPSVAIHGDGGGYTPASIIDADDDGVCDAADACAGSDLRPTVSMGTCETGVPNAVDARGCTLQDRIDVCGFSAVDHGRAGRCVAALTNDLFKGGSLTARDRARILSCTHGRESRPRTGAGRSAAPGS